MSTTYITYRIFIVDVLGCDHIPHACGSLWAHLRDTAELLRGWGQSPAIIDAGLFHSIYGTSQFKHASFPIEGRHIIRHLIGTKAEELAFEFCTLDRRRFPWGTFLPPERRAQLYTIEAANLIDQRDPPENIAVLMATGLLSQRVFDACAAYVVAHTEMHRDAS